MDSGLPSSMLTARLDGSALEVPQQDRKQILRDSGARAENDHAGNLTRQLSHLALHLRVEIEDLPGESIHPIARLGETDAIVGAIEKTRVELFLELANLERDGGLGHVQCFGRPGEAQVTSTRIEDLQSSLSHASPLSSQTSSASHGADRYR